MLYLWTVVHIGRPHELVPFLYTIHLGDISAGLCIVSFIMFGDKREPVLKSPEFKLFLALFAIALISTPFSVYRRYSANFVYFFFVKFGLYLYFFAKLINTRERIEQFIKILLFSGFLMAVTAVIQRQAGMRTQVGFSFDPNDLALLMVAILPIAMAQMMKKKGFLSYNTCFF
jgi:hypothetical protein